MHALNNIWKNYSVEKSETTFTINCTKKNQVDIQKVCKEMLQEKIQKSPQKFKKRVSKEFACDDNGMFPDEVMQRVILLQPDTSINDFSYLLKGQQKNPQKRKKNLDDYDFLSEEQIEEDHTNLYKELKKRIKTNKQIMGYLIANGPKNVATHYACMIPWKKKLLWVDSLDTHTLDENKKMYPFSRLNTKNFLKKCKHFFMLWEIVDTEAVDLSTEQETTEEET